MPNAWSPVIKIAKYTLTDEVKQKSFIVMFILCALFIFLVRGCYQGNYMMNGQEVDAAKVVILVSKITFHVIAVGVMLLAALLSMRVFRRDSDEGTQSCILSKPITRNQYVAGKVLGLWFLTAAFMFILHGIVFLISSFKLNTIMPEFLVASLLCSLNLLFIVIAVLLLTLVMSDVAALLFVIGVALFGLVADGIYAVSHSPMGQVMMQEQARPDANLWTLIYYAWPKVSGAERFASLLIGSEGVEIGSIYPLVNIVAYCVVLGAILFWRFRKEDIV